LRNFHEEKIDCSIRACGTYDSGSNSEARHFAFMSRRLSSSACELCVLWIPDHRSATVYGHFAAAGGSGNDIQVVIGLQDEVLNWVNGHGGNVTFATQKMTAGQLEVPLDAPGDYILVFNNNFSAFSSKVVRADVQIIPRPQN